MLVHFSVCTTFATAFDYLKAYFKPLEVRKWVCALQEELTQAQSFREAQQKFQQLTELGPPVCPERDNQHGNSYLLFAIAYNYTEAALFLIDLGIENHPQSLLMPDLFTSSRSSPLILASKTANNPVAFKLIDYFETHSLTDALNATDYNGNTALHYACLTRNHALIEKLLNAGARTDIVNGQPHSPYQTAYDYYLLEATKASLFYPYGTCAAKTLLFCACDFSPTYQGTNEPAYSFIRWFIHFIILNLGLCQGENETFKPSYGPAKAIWFDAAHPYLAALPKSEKTCKATHISLQKILLAHQISRTPVIDHRLYQQLLALFIKHHQSNYFTDIADKLKITCCDLSIREPQEYQLSPFIYSRALVLYESNKSQQALVCNQPLIENYFS